MYNLLCKTILSILLLLSIVFVANAQTEYLATVNPLTGAYLKVKSIPPVRYIALFDYSTIDQNNHRFFFRGSYNGYPDSLFTLDETTGNTISAVSFSTNNVVAMMYSNTLNVLYGLQAGTGSEALVVINPATAVVTAIKNISGISSSPSDEFTLDENNNQLIIKGSGTTGSLLTTVDLLTGNVLTQVPIQGNIYGLQYDNNLHALFAIYYQTGHEYFCMVNVNTGVVTTIGSLDPVQGIGGGNFTYDQTHHIYYFVGGPTTGSYLYSIDATTGITIASPYVDESNSLTEGNIIQFRYDNVLDTMFALHWEPCNAVTPTNITTIICPGTTYQLPSGRVISTAGFYQDTLRNSAGCDIIITALTLSVHTGSARDTTINATICSGSSYQLPSGYFVNSANIYTDIIRSSAGCDSVISTVNLTVNNSSLTTIINKAICFGDTYQLPSGALVNNTGTYLDTVRSIAGCDSMTATVNLTVYSASLANITATICNGTNYQLPAGKIVTGAGLYQDTIKNFLGCDSIITTANLSLYPAFVYSVTDSFNQGQSYKLPSGIIVNSAGVYQSILSDVNGCDSTIITTLVARSSLDCVSPPNAFTPNADGYNDVWVVYQHGCVQRVKVDVYNRWGSLVYHSDNYNNDWNGEYDNKPLPDATYYYVVRPVYADGRQPVLKGNVTILR